MREAIAAREHIRGRIERPHTVALLESGREVLFRELRERRVGVQISTNSLASTDNLPSYAHAMLQRKAMLEELALAFDIREMRPQPADRRTLIFEYDRLRAAGGAEARSPIVSLHAKSMVVDQDLALIGSYNLGPRSAALNSEVILAVWDEAFTAELAQHIEQDCAPAPRRRRSAAVRSTTASRTSGSSPAFARRRSRSWCTWPAR